MDKSSSQIDEAALESNLETRGWHHLPHLLTPAECTDLAGQFDCGDRFRSKIIMERHGFGRGEYGYFRYPLPNIVENIRASFYPPLARIANKWAQLAGDDAIFPEDHRSFLARCHASGQARPTPLLLRYRKGDFNCLHQDIYGDIYFPFQLAVLLSDPCLDFEGGEFVMTEQRPRMQSRPHVVPLGQGDCVIFAVNEAPRAGVRRSYRVRMRHGVAEIRRGERFAMGVIFHDAK